MGDKSLRPGDFSEELEELEIQNLRVIGQAALLEEASRMEQEAHDAPDPADPEDLRQFLNQAAKIQRKERVREGLKSFYRMTSKASVFLLVLLVGAGIAAFNVDAIRIPLVNWLVHVQETHTDIHFLPEGEGKSEIEFGYLPEGYTLESTDMLALLNTYYLSNGVDDPITVIQGDLHADFSVDTEGADISNTTLKNGQSALIIKKDGLTQVVWSNNRYSFTVEGTIDISELIKVAEGIKL